MGRTKKNKLKQKKEPKNPSSTTSSVVNLKPELGGRKTNNSVQASISHSEIISGKDEKCEAQSTCFYQGQQRSPRRRHSTSGAWMVESLAGEREVGGLSPRNELRRTTRSISQSESIDLDLSWMPLRRRKRKSDPVESVSKDPIKKRGRNLPVRKQRARSREGSVEGTSDHVTTEEMDDPVEKTSSGNQVCSPDSEPEQSSNNSQPESRNSSPLGMESDSAPGDAKYLDYFDSVSSAEDSQGSYFSGNSYAQRTVCKLHQLFDGTCKYRVFIHKCEEEAIVVLPEGEEVLFQGFVKVRCLYGSVEIMGFKMTCGKSAVSVYSAESYCLLPIKALQQGSLEDREKFSSLAGYETVWREVMSVVDEQSVVLSLSKLKSPELEFVCREHPFRDLFSCMGGAAGRRLPVLPPQVYSMLEISPPTNMAPVFAETTDFSSVASKLIVQSSCGHLTVAVTGGKDVGKSTFCRYLVNQLLNQHENVAFLECDIGQTEFTPPGCVSLNLISSPLLGPAFTHQRQPERMVYVGAVSPGSDPEYYGECLKYVYQTYSSLPGQPPLVINCMGWNKGLGLMILASTLRMTRPDYVVQINSPNPTRNSVDINTEFVKQSPGWESTPPPPEGFHYNHHTLLTLNALEKSSLQSGGFRPSDYRDIALLAYLGQLGQDCPGLASLRAQKPYHIPWNLVAAHVCHEQIVPSQILCALNASVVGLCVIQEDEMIDPGQEDLPKLLNKNPVCECIGFGVVRGVDMVEKELLVVTPVSPSDLLEVNCLICGIVRLPQQLVLNEILGGEDTPYVSSVSDDVTGAAAIKPRRHLLRKGEKSPSQITT